MRSIKTVERWIHVLKHGTGTSKLTVSNIFLLQISTELAQQPEIKTAEDF